MRKIKATNQSVEFLEHEINDRTILVWKYPDSVYFEINGKTIRLNKSQANKIAKYISSRTRRKR